MPRFAITHTVSIYQFERTGDTEAYSNTPAYTDKNATISPTSVDIQSSGDVPAFQLFEIFIWDITVSLHNGDKIIDQNDTEYIVSGVPYDINNQFLQYTRVLARQVV